MSRNLQIKENSEHSTVQNVAKQEHFSDPNTGKYGSEKLQVGHFLGHPRIAVFTETVMSK